MPDRLKSLLPGPVRNLLRPLYYHLWARWRLKQKRKLVTRDWEMDISVPEERKEEFLRSVLRGRLNFPVQNERTNILLCAQPKSASLYIVQMLALALDFENHQIGFNRSGGEIYYPRLLAAKFTGTDTISHSHAPPTPLVREIITTLDFRPLVLTRNLLDALVSRRDMLVREEWAPHMFSREAMETFLEGSGEYQMDVVIDLFAHSYINFYVGWDRHREDPELNPVYITYQELVEDEPGMVRRVASELGVEVNEKEVRRLSEKIEEAGGINYNQGRTGRGREQLTGQQLAVLREKARMLGCRDEPFLGFDPQA